MNASAAKTIGAVMGSALPIVGYLAGGFIGIVIACAIGMVVAHVLMKRLPY